MSLSVMRCITVYILFWQGSSHIWQPSLLHDWLALCSRLPWFIPIQISSDEVRVLWKKNNTSLCNEFKSNPVLDVLTIFKKKAKKKELWPNFGCFFEIWQKKTKTKGNCRPSKGPQRGTGTDNEKQIAQTQTELGEKKKIRKVRRVGGGGGKNG